MSPAIQRQLDAAVKAGTLAHPAIDETLGDRVRADDIRYSCGVCFEAFFYASHAASHMAVAGHHRMRSFTPMGGLR